MLELSRRECLTAGLGACLLPLAGTTFAADSNSYHLKLRSRRQDGKPAAAEATTAVEWNPRQTAIIVCDMWDRHWCKSAERRVGELVGPVNSLLNLARDRDSFIIHAPSSVTKFYEGTPQRTLAQNTPATPTPSPLATSPRWGTAWCWTDGRREGVLPIDDSDMGCDCEVPCPIEPPWTRQHAGIELHPGDALTDDGQETWNLLQWKGIRHILICGVHLNMCVLGRPFGIRQMVGLGQDIVLLRDLTDTMYNPQRPPGVSHFDGTSLMVKHVENYWCPTCLSSDLTGQPAFRFAGAPQPA